MSEKFSQIEKKDIELQKGDDLGGCEPPILPEDFAKLVYYVPFRDSMMLSFQWQLPWQVGAWLGIPRNCSEFLGIPRNS